MRISLPWLTLGALTGVATVLVLRGPKPPPSETPVTHATAETTREMFKLGGVMKLQRALKVPVSGVLDMQTQQALRMHQREHDIVETGLPDFESVKSLGIEPEEMFHHFVPAERGAP